MCITRMNIVFTANSSYADHLAVAMCSLFENNQGLAFDVYIINADMDQAPWRALEGIAKRYGHHLIDVKISDQDLNGLVTSYHFRKESYYRLFIAEKLQLAKALFLDADIVVNGSINDLYSTDVSDCYLAAVINPGFDRHEGLEMSEESKYFNAGVMLLNLAWCRRDHLKERVINFVMRKPWAVPFLEQCGLNSVINGRWKELHPKFNLQGCFFETKIGTYSTQFPDGYLMDAVQNPVIIHYSGSGKPWHFGYKHPYRKLYWKYLRMTPFRRRLSNDFTLLKVIKWCVPKGVKNAVKILSQSWMRNTT
jgi:lipopolysaccharide biosynthesis glycosyltransferase